MLKLCCEKMVADGNTLTRSLTKEVDEYRKQLEVADRAAALDRLTGLGSRRSFERRLETAMRAQKPFSLILIDLDDFKSMNDSHGHLVGDDLLRQFSAELLGQLTPLETAYRWGGDEFTVLLPGGDKEAKELVSRIKRWVLGDYKIKSGTETIQRVVEASFGVVQWDLNETSLELVARADQELYREKGAALHTSA
jgi:diguanylate cyclase (GGDEF)-like protein